MQMCSKNNLNNLKSQGNM